MGAERSDEPSVLPAICRRIRELRLNQEEGPATGNRRAKPRLIRHLSFHHPRCHGLEHLWLRIRSGLGWMGMGRLGWWMGWHELLSNPPDSACHWIPDD